jgi:hypothetical protein
MDETAEPWDKSVPPDLIPAIEHLRKLFDDAHWRCGQTTQAFCYWLLHDQVTDDPATEFTDAILYIKKMVGLSAARRFDDLIKGGTPSAIFKAFYDLYLDAMSVQALLVFKELVEIGLANRDSLSTSYLKWAEAQTKHLIGSHTHAIKIWVRDVCDKQVYDPKDAPDEFAFWRKWQAPRLIVMTPSRHLPYETARVWERYDVADSLRLLEAFAETYIIKLEMSLRRVAGQAALNLAKQPKPTQLTERKDAGEDKGIPKKGKLYTPNNARRESRKLTTQARYAKWQKQYRKLKKSRPEMSDTWHSRQIARMDIAEGSSAETIRKHMKK